MGQVDEPVPGEGGGQLPVVLVLENPQGVLQQGDLLPRGGELPQGHVGPGAQDIPPAFNVVDQVVVFQIGRRLGEAQPHLVGILLDVGQLQPHQLAHQAVAAHAQPVQRPDGARQVLLLPGQGEQGLLNLAEQPHVQLPPAVEELGGELLQLRHLLPAGTVQVVQHGEQVLPQQLHVPPAQPDDLGPVFLHLGGVFLKGEPAGPLPLGEDGELPQIVKILLLIRFHAGRSPPFGQAVGLSAGPSWAAAVPAESP